MLVFVKFAVKSSWVGSNTDIFMPVYSAGAGVLGFTRVL